MKQSWKKHFGEEICVLCLGDADGRRAKLVSSRRDTAGLLAELAVRVAARFDLPAVPARLEIRRKCNIFVLKE